jgi:hypothetical protein
MAFRDLKLEDCTKAFDGHGQLPTLQTRALRGVGL